MIKKANLLSKQVALVTGADHKLGRSLALAFSGAGALTALTGSNKEMLNQTALAIHQLGGICHPFAVEVKTALDARTVAAEVCALLGEIDILVNCAGLQREGTPGSENPPDLPLWWMAAAEASMSVRGGGVILNLASATAPVSQLFRPTDVSPNYFADKAGLVKLTNACAPRLLEENIRIHALCPTWIESDAESQPALAAGVCQLALYLCTAEGDRLNGQVLSVDYPSKGG